MISYRYLEDDTGSLRIYKRPEPGRLYTLGIDAATGLGGDNSSGVVLTNTLPFEQVAVFRNKIQVNDFTSGMNDLGRWYNEAMIICEINYPGNSVQDALLQHYSYPRNYQPETHLKENYEITCTFGFRTSEASKWLLINETQLALAAKELKLNDLHTISEFLNFVYQENKRKAGAAEGFTDDDVMATMLALHGAKLYPQILTQPIKQLRVPVSVEAKQAWRQWRAKFGTPKNTQGVIL